MWKYCHILINVLTKLVNWLHQGFDIGRDQNIDDSRIYKFVRYNNSKVTKEIVLFFEKIYSTIHEFPH